MGYQKHSREFKLKLVREVLAPKSNAAKVERKYKLKRGSLSSWVKKYQREILTTTPYDIAVIPDQQVKPDVDISYIPHLTRWHDEYRPPVIVLMGDYGDMPSLGTHSKIGSKYFEGKRYQADIDSVHRALDLQIGGINKINGYNPTIYMIMGNHEHRITRAIENDPVHLEGLISLDDLKYEDYGIEVIPFLEILKLSGVWFSHYFYNQNSGRPYCGQIVGRIEKVGNSFVQGHEQGLLTGHKPLADGKIHRGIVAGSCYLHDEEYKGAQGNGHWRGALMLRNVCEGNFDLREFRIETLKESYD